MKPSKFVERPPVEWPEVSCPLRPSRISCALHGQLVGSLFALRGSSLSTRFALSVRSRHERLALARCSGARYLKPGRNVTGLIARRLLAAAIDVLPPLWSGTAGAGGQRIRIVQVISAEMPLDRSWV